MRPIIKKTYTCFFFSLALLSLLDPALAFVQQFNIADRLPNWLPSSAALFIFRLFTVTLPWLIASLATALALLFALGTSARYYSIVVVIALQLLYYFNTGILTFSWYSWVVSLPSVLGAVALIPITVLVSLKRF